jgi:FAD/FMN-containing dehydrogenase
VVTSLAFRTLPAPAATAFRLRWPYPLAATVTAAWQDWAPDAPDELAASLLVTAAGALERPPEVHLFGTMLGSETDAGALLEELVARAGADPASAVLEHAGYRETKRYLAEHGPGDDRPLGHPYSKSEFFRRPLPAEAIASLLEHLGAGRVAGQSRELDFTPWGGAYNRVPAEATAFAHRAERFLLKHEVVVDASASEAERQAANRWLSRSWALVHPCGSGGVYSNFPDPELEDWDRAYHGANLDRLRRVKTTYDPGNVFRFDQSIPPM